MHCRNQRADQHDSYHSVAEDCSARAGNGRFYLIEYLVELNLVVSVENPEHKEEKEICKKHQYTSRYNLCNMFFGRLWLFVRAVVFKFFNFLTQSRYLVSSEFVFNKHYFIITYSYSQDVNI